MIDEARRDLRCGGDATERDEETRRERQHDRVRSGECDPSPDPGVASGEVHGESWRVPEQELAARLGFEDLDPAALEAILDCLEEILDSQAERPAPGEQVLHRRQQFFGT